jgi:hypothetical protein
MKSRTLIALAVAGTFACGSAIAAGFHSGATHSGMNAGSTHEVQTPMSVDESAPWRANEQHTAGWSSSSRSSDVIGMQEGLHSDGPLGMNSGMSSDASASGSGGFDSSASLSGEPVALTITEYWLVGADDSESATGASSSFAGSGSGGFDSSAAYESSMSGDPALYGPTFDTSMNSSGGIDYWLFGDSSDPMSAPYSTMAAGSDEFTLALDEPVTALHTTSAEEIASTFGDTTPLLSEHYLVSSLSNPYPILLEVGPAREDIALLNTLSGDFYILTPMYDEG